MTRRKRVLVWGCAVVSVLALSALSLFFVNIGLSKADQWASAIAVFVTLIGLGITVYRTVVPIDRSPQHPARPDSGEVDSPSTTDQGGQQVKAGRDAYVAGRDQHFHGPRST